MTQLIVVTGVNPPISIILSRLSPQEGHTINNAEGFLEDARKSFGLAAKATGPKEIERFAAMGRDYLGLAHQAEKLDEPPQKTPSLFP